MTKQEHNRKYYLKNREDIIKQVKEYAFNHPEVNKKATSKWREKNRGYERQRSKMNHIVRKQLVKEYNQVYRQTERGRIFHQLSELKRRAIRTDGNADFDYQQWIEMRTDNKCLACGKSEPEIKLTIDHIIPLSKGGKHIKENIQPLCFSCNVRKYTAIVDYRRGQIL